MKLLVVTGLSGAGKSLAVNALEDISKITYQILFLDSADEVLERRYKETRRMHPLSSYEGLSTSEAIGRERALLRPLYEKADYVVDTSLLSTAQNKERICSLFLQSHQQPMVLTLMSFGFKYGLPKEADIVLDVRCLPNPFYVPELKAKTGMDPEVAEYVMQFPQARELLRHIEALLDFSLPLYVKEGKSQLTVAVGCTGGKHRSITFVRLLAEHCRTLGYAPGVQHRDAGRVS